MPGMQSEQGEGESKVAKSGEVGRGQTPGTGEPLIILTWQVVRLDLHFRKIILAEVGRSPHTGAVLG